MRIKDIFPFIHFWVGGLQLLIFHCSYSQDTIYFKNPSFEDIPRIGGKNSIPIKEWQDCGLNNFPDETPPDILPVPGGAWGVTKNPFDGNTYLGMVTRYSYTYESISQLLTQPVEVGRCYKFSVYLALSETYDSATRRSGHGATENFSHPVELFIWGGDDYCKTHQLLARSGPVNDNDWTQFIFKFSPKKNYQYITIGAYFENGYKEPYNGHVLVDRLSPITKMECY